MRRMNTISRQDVDRFAHSKVPPGPGRPSRCTPEAVGMLKGVIRELGLSDSAAAVRLGTARGSVE